MCYLYMNNVQSGLMEYCLYFIIKMIIRLDFHKLYLKMDLMFKNFIFVLSTLHKRRLLCLNVGLW